MNKIFYFSRETEQELFYRTRLQLCPDLIHSNEFSLYNDGSVLVGGKVMSGHNYCISSALLWFCNSVYNRYLCILFLGAVAPLGLAMSVSLWTLLKYEL